MLEFDIWTILFSIVNILVLFIFLKIFLFGRVNRIMEERAARIQSDLDQAKSEAEKAEQLRTEYEASIADAKDTATKIVSQAQKTADQQIMDARFQAQQEAAQILTEAQKEIALERKRSMDSAQNEIADLALAAASKIIGSQMDEAQNRSIVDAFLHEEGTES